MFKRLLLSLTAIASIFAQTSAPTPGVTSAVNAYQTTFNSAYYASKPPAYQTLYNGRPGSGNPSALPLDTTTQWNTCGTLISQGYIVDEQIDCQAMDPYTTMYMREFVYGQTWTLAGAGAVQVTNISQPGAVVTPGEFTGPVPAGAIPVCVLLSCYPAYVAPVSPVTTTPTQPLAPVSNPVGSVEFLSGTPPAYLGSEFKCVVGANGQDGYAFGALWTGTTQGLSGTWQKISTMLGMAAAWQKTQ